jgi:uncharacterized membrane protein (UPF0136 family)
MKKINPYLLFFIILLTSAGGGIGLKYAGIDTNVILLGFRFNLPLIFALSLILIPEGINFLKEFAVYFEYKKYYRLLLIIVLIFGAGSAAILYSAKGKYSEPEYFYELGLSSLVDFPVYLTWNMPILLSIFGVLFYFRKKLKVNLIFGFIFIAALLITEYYPFEVKKLFMDREIVTVAFLIFVLASFYRVKNSLLFAIFVFAAIWLNILLFGSSSETVVKLILAKNFDKWEGFIKLGKEISSYVQPAAFLLLSGAVLLTGADKKEEQIRAD